MSNGNKLKAGIWSMFFSSITGFQYHPKNAAENRMTVEDCAKCADLMWVEFEKRFPEKKSWDGSPQPR